MTDLIEQVRDNFFGKHETIVATGYDMFQDYIDNTRGRASTQSLSICQTPDYYIAKAGYEAAVDQIAQALLEQHRQLQIAREALEDAHRGFLFAERYCNDWSADAEKTPSEYREDINLALREMESVATVGADPVATSCSNATDSTDRPATIKHRDSAPDGCSWVTEVKE